MGSADATVATPRSPGNDRARTPARRIGASLVGLTAIVVALGGCADRPRHPNLLLIAVDTLRADHLGAYGYDRGTSPAIDRFFASAVVFDRAHATAPWTLPSFASLMTSHYTSTHRCWGYDSRLGAPFVTLAERLRDVGFGTGAVVSHVFLDSRFGLGQGFEDYDESLVYSARESHEAISSPAVTARAIAALDRLADARPVEPWFLWVHYFDPHFFYRVHTGITEQYGGRQIDRYDGEIEFTDHHIGRLLDHLEARGLADETIVVFVADHGEAFGERGQYLHGWTLHAEVMRVPFAIRASGIAPRRVSSHVSLVDFVPTALELLGLPPPAEPVAGRSLVPLMRGATLPPRGVLMETRLDIRWIVEAYVSGDWKLIVEKPNEREMGRATDPARSTEPVQLFDLSRDPSERTNVAARRSRVVARLRTEMDREVAVAMRRGAHVKRAEPASLSPDVRRRLQALGYVEKGGGDSEAPAVGETGAGRRRE